MTRACTCGASTCLHDVGCAIVAATQPNAMINDAGDVFYPDGPEDAAWFAREHGARPYFADLYAGLPALAAHCDEQRAVCLGDGYTASTLADAWKKLGDAARELCPQTLGDTR